MREVLKKRVSVLVKGKSYAVILEPDKENGGYDASCPALLFCHAAGDSKEEAIREIKLAIEKHLEAKAAIKKRPYRDEKTPSVINVDIGHDIKLKISATPQDWRKFADELKNSPTWVISDISKAVNSLILSHFPREKKHYPDGSFDAGWHEPDNRPKPRGNHKRTQEPVKKIGTDAKWLYLFISYFKKQPGATWPEPLLRLLEAYKKDTGKKRLWTPVELTMFCLQKVYAQELKDNPDLKPFEKEESFEVTYLYNNDEFEAIKKKYFKNASSERVSAYLSQSISYLDVRSKNEIQEPIGLNRILKAFLKTLHK